MPTLTLPPAAWVSGFRHWLLTADSIRPAARQTALEAEALPQQARGIAQSGDDAANALGTYMRGLDGLHSAIAMLEEDAHPSAAALRGHYADYRSGADRQEGRLKHAAAPPPAAPTSFALATAASTAIRALRSATAIASAA